jgi:hypothetical protein
MTLRNRPADIDDLWLLHWPRQPETATLPDAVADDLRRRSLFLDTCLRQLALGIAPRPQLDLSPADAGVLAVGVDAYRAALEITTGLRSCVAGETNVFGQFRAAWREAGNRLPGPARRSLAPVIEALLADTREIRQRHLQHVGGQSYGSLVRRLLAPRPGARVLFVGAGDLARSMLPLFRACATGMWNHRAAPMPGGISVAFAPDNADAAAAWAEHVILTTPPDDAHDAAWAARLALQRVRGVVHLGRRRDNAGPWQAPAPGYDLDDVFDLARDRQDVRSLKLAQARRACEELAERRRPGTAPLLPALLARA